MAADLGGFHEDGDHHDDGMHTDPFGNLYCVMPLPPQSSDQSSSGQSNPQGGGASGGSGSNGGPSGTLPLTDTFKLHSRPTATKTIYLDFDGFTAVGTSWNRSSNINRIVSPAYDPDGNGAAFSDRELTTIQSIWQRVAADFSPFDVNVTTEDPGEQALVNTGGTDDRWGIRAVITPDNFTGQAAGGFAYIGSFRWGYESAGATDTPCYIFNTGASDVSAAVSHEVGHSLGLSHDGTNGNNPFQQNAEYYNGHGGRAENGWGPIMGSGYYSNVTTWDNGVYFGANNLGAGANYNSGADDLQVIVGPLNGFGYAPDDFGSTDQTASDLTGPIDAADQVIITQLGTIEQTNDKDVFKFQAGSGILDLTIDPYITQVWTKAADGSFSSSIESSLFNPNYWPDNQGANLDIEATLLDASGNVVATANQEIGRAHV